MKGKKFFKKAEIKAIICRNIDDKITSFSFKINANGTYEVFTNFGNQIKEFIGNSIGWISFESNSPFLSEYYITENGKGVVGADYLF